MLEFIEPIARHFTAEQLSAPDEFIEHTHDSHRLKLIFGQLAECKNDSEQRTWMLHEDEDYIVQFLTELIDILVSLWALYVAIRREDKYVDSCDFATLQRACTFTSLNLFIFLEKCRQKGLSIRAVV